MRTTFVYLVTLLTLVILAAAGPKSWAVDQHQVIMSPSI